MGELTCDPAIELRIAPLIGAPPEKAPLAEDAECHVVAGDVSAFSSVPRPAGAERGTILWPYLLAVVAMHLLLPLVAIPWLFSWTGLLLVPLGNYVFTSLGIGAGFHRLLTHRSYQCPKWLEHLFALFGVCALQDSPARWVVVHRLHHQHSDHQSDPHSPMVSWFWGHMGWLFVRNPQLHRLDTYERYAPDLLKDPFYFRLERGATWVWVYVAHAVLFYLVGFAVGWATTGTVMGGVQFGLSVFLYGVVVRTVYGWHITWGVNSLGHMFGYRTFNTDENSRNNWFFALLTNGDGWHNNHHADPRSAAHGFNRWWELDVTFLSLRCLAALGLVHHIVPRRRNEPEYS
ncbi:MAG TPA: fatty acid desaturase [Planctomycetaceae bacterium]|jgi:stearoyl-CoA desaturase (delta-9 desaturase)|nr:fatty acid desaturase [Planctomycetaceae bacterium]